MEPRFITIEVTHIVVTTSARRVQMDESWTVEDAKQHELENCQMFVNRINVVVKDEWKVKSVRGSISR